VKDDVLRVLLQLCIHYDGNPTVFQREARSRRIKQLRMIHKLCFQIKSARSFSGPQRPWLVGIPHALPCMDGHPLPYDLPC
jgi:hypothetical protein